MRGARSAVGRAVPGVGRWPLVWSGFGGPCAPSIPISRPVTASRADRTAYRQGKCALAAGDASGRHLALLALAPRCACRAPDICYTV